LIKDAEARVEEGVKAAAARGIGVAGRVLVGLPFQTIIEAARAADVDLIVMGTHGRTGFSHLLLGSVAERVVRHAPCPVLVVRERERAEPVVLAPAAAAI
jgi:nucleotide-binding universal stress UspA family protein